MSTSSAVIVLAILVVLLIILIVMFLKEAKIDIFRKMIIPDPSRITALEYRTTAYSLELEKRNDIWYLIDSDWEADPDRVEQLLSRLRDLEVDERISGSHDDPEFNIGCNGYLILDYDGDVITIAIGNRVEDDDECVYITKTGDPDILVVHANALSLLNKERSVAASGFIFNAYYPHVSSVSIRYGKTLLLLTKVDDSWFFGGKSVKEAKALRFIEDLCSIEAAGYAPDDTDLPKQPLASITMKVNRRGITRLFFHNPDIKSRYLMPMKGRILYIDKDVMKNVLSWSPR